MPEHRTIELEPSAIRRVPKQERWALWTGLVFFAVLLVLQMSFMGWPWSLLLQIGFPSFMIGGALFMLVKNIN